ncbi:von Willebrand factor, type A [Mycolicibacterium phlei]|uniref:von Willebrand factor A n=1 Tax=Mycolicibacterium phlei DSM 43239 = CCUG 21000 TaxID=1226750 RepID=A0A5N5V052_MYCPH|nr:VWA domain-containing protein [Mycolicibacterium phlei]AMO62551.1 von Willebrand factor type A domain protein [Mycolicibacterium phlei]KAB7755048.1 von Willebrand factor A [Mycolicibacterium phlei DSM 43239 = CCUG 21000]KXW61532.1 von Willebrand factor A [Mycolicibacterium phlei DSM 43239 = CCUG 21000]KXW65610.1 von Willebrand factor A [Mycolicibacterium phlei DSM 43070]KXW70965.1 von Willebrand factor A [Mycolicibacterium phlei DSM 43072]
MNRFRLLATHIAGRPVDIATAPEAHTNGRVVFVSDGASPERQRREVVLQSALIGAGSLQPALVRPLRARPALARRYLSVEGRRVLDELAHTLPLAAALSPGHPETSSAAESLDLARSRTRIADPPDWFGVLKPSALLGAPAESAAADAADEQDLHFTFERLPDDKNDEDDEDGPAEESRILKIFDNPLFNSKTAGDFLRKLLGTSRSSGTSAAGGDMRAEAVRRVRSAGPNARPLPTRIRFTDDERPGAAIGVGGALHPEWDVFGDRYRPQWCRVIDYPLTAPADVAAATVRPDDVLRRRLARVGLGPKVLRRRSDGDDLDVGALVDLAVDLRSGFSPPEHIFTEHRKIARNLGVLILVDASGSATESDPAGRSVHELQRRSAATLAATLEELGDRVAVYAFRSKGRHAVQLPAIKTFEQRFGALPRARLNQLQPSGYTRLGAAIRGAGEILKTEAGTQNRLLLVISDGHPYDDGYEGRYAEADARKALEELRGDGVACLCLSLGATTESDALERVFGAASHAHADTLADLSPRMDELFLAALRELAAPRPRPAPDYQVLNKRGAVR